MLKVDNKLTLDADFWNNRYLNAETGWNIGYPSTPIKTYIDQLQNKEVKILIPGCGNAYEAEYLHKKGFENVYLVDLATEALKNFQQRLPDFPASQLLCEDFFKHEGVYDLIIEQTFFCAISPTLRQHYADQAAKLIKPGGKLIGLLFNDKLNDDKPPFGGNKEEYLAYFSDTFIIELMEEAKNSIPERQGRELFIKLIRK